MIARAVTDLAGPGLAEQRDELAGAHVEVHVADGADVAVAGSERHREAAYGQRGRRRLCHVHFLVHRSSVHGSLTDLFQS